MRKNYCIFVFGGRSKAVVLQGQQFKKMMIFQLQGMLGSTPVCLFLQVFLMLPLQFWDCIISGKVSFYSAVRA